MNTVAERSVERSTDLSWNTYSRASRTFQLRSRSIKQDVLQWC